MHLELPFAVLVDGPQHIDVQAGPARLVEQYGDEQGVTIVEEETELSTILTNRHILDVPTAKLFDGVSDAAEVGDGGDHRAGWFIP